MYVVMYVCMYVCMYVYCTYYAPICDANGMEKASFARIVGAVKSSIHSLAVVFLTDFIDDFMSLFK